MLIFQELTYLRNWAQPPGAKRLDQNGGTGGEGGDRLKASCLFFCRRYPSRWSKFEGEDSKPGSLPHCKSPQKMNTPQGVC